MLIILKFQRLTSTIGINAPIVTDCQRYHYQPHQERSSMPGQQIPEDIVQLWHKSVRQTGEQQRQRSQHHPDINQHRRRFQLYSMHLIVAHFGKKSRFPVYFYAVPVEHGHETVLDQHQQRSILDHKQLIALFSTVLEGLVTSETHVVGFVVEVQPVLLVLDALGITVEHGVDCFHVH